MPPSGPDGKGYAVRLDDGTVVGHCPQFEEDRGRARTAGELSGGAGGAGLPRRGGSGGRQG